MIIYAVSDVHIKYNENQDDLERKNIFVRFLESIHADADVLILNGDIFDLWIEWKYIQIAAYFPVIRQLKKLSEKGCRIIYLAGNHDFWMGEYLKKEIGAGIYPDHCRVELDNKNYFISHGDLLTINDMRYHIFRAVIRRTIVKRIVQMLHPDFVLKIGAGLSRTSRNRTKPRRLGERQGQGLFNYAKAHADEYDIFLMGHIHQPKIEKIEKSILVNSGDWITHRTYVKIIDGEPQLMDFETNKQYSLKEK
jgi:UDP-2,3-diacylglucosamine hydrolase